MFCLRFDNGDKLGIENPIQISKKIKRKERRERKENRTLYLVTLL
jgi:hypothetical protein